ncbi:MAG: DUF1540 domain-containing protein [Firmicutes bacterium]|nr:DUF1540 domain-containing protein [Bacillota bacterium]
MSECGCEKNTSIKCTVDQCRYHCPTADYCSLKEIQVGCHEPNPTVSECTDCCSFQLKS